MKKSKQYFTVEEVAVFGETPMNAGHAFYRFELMDGKRAVFHAYFAHHRNEIFMAAGTLQRHFACDAVIRNGVYIAPSTATSGIMAIMHSSFDEFLSSIE